jgi:hypothetical protein
MPKSITFGTDRVHEQLQTGRGRDVVAVAILCDGNAANQLHDEVRTAGFRRSGVIHLSNSWMIHHGQGLPLRLEAGNHLASVHTQLDDLERHLPVDRLSLLGHVDDREAAFTDQFQELVTPNPRAGTLDDRGMVQSRADLGRWSLEEIALRIIGAEQRGDSLESCPIRATSLTQIDFAFM